MLGDEKFTADKNRRKRIRMVFEILVLFGIAFLIVSAFFTLNVYKPNDEASVDMGGTMGASDTGFLALSYFGVDRTGETATLIGRDRLRSHLRLLYDRGYVTVTQSDIEAYYKEGRPLPKRALFLMFEDGRRDTAIFSQQILEDYNFKASMMTYPEKFIKEDPTFLHPADLKELEKTSYWELGTNGYRLAFINVFDRYGGYIGELDPLRFSMMHWALGRRYNHYLMDFIRDKNGVPKESTGRMRRRISADYEQLRDVYTQELGVVPGLYVLMHANTGAFGNNPKVSALNGQWIRRLFRMNFNREGYSFNQQGSSVYDLTRMQPQADWADNHLLMRIKYDINQPIEFETGDAEKQKSWELLEGASEIRGEEYILTSLPEGNGRARLKNSSSWRDVHVAVELKGNSYGAQTIYLRADEKLSRYIAVKLAHGELIVAENSGNGERELYRNHVITIEGGKIPSVPEDRRSVEVLEYDTLARYADSPEQAKEYAARAAKRRQEEAPSVEDGAEPWMGVMDRNVRSHKKLQIDLTGGEISVTLDGHAAAERVAVHHLDSGSLYLEAGWTQTDTWSQRNLADDVYDGRFLKLTVSADQKAERVLYTLQETGMEKVKMRIEEIWEKILGFFLTQF